MNLLPARASTVIRAYSSGGGAQSVAVAVLQAQGLVHYDLHIFANVGADSENPDTLAYVENYLKPYCADHHIPLVEVWKKKRDGSQLTLLENLKRSQRSIDIPARMANGAPGNRHCTDHFKIEVIQRYIKQQGGTHLVQGLGISTDEIWRVRDGQWHEDNGIWVQRDYPLVNLRLTRQDCLRITAEAGLPEAPKSSCVYCPYHKRNEWMDMKRNHPDRFEIAVGVERLLNERRDALGKDRVYLHPDCVPLEHAVGNQLLLFDLDALTSCDSGVCMI